jgi:hypothetical protein
MTAKTGEAGIVAWISQFNRAKNHNPKNPETGRPYVLGDHLPIGPCNSISEHQTRITTGHDVDQFACFLGEMLDSRKNLIIRMQEDLVDLKELNQLISETEMRFVQGGCSDLVEKVLKNMKSTTHWDDSDFRKDTATRSGVTGLA